MLLGGDNIADIQRITIVADPANANGSAFGGIRAGNAVFGNLDRNNEVITGVVGIAATNVAVQDVVRIGDINASGTGSPTLQFGANSQFGTVTVAGGDLVNSQTIANAGYNYNLVLAAGAKSNDAPLPAQNTYSQLSFTQAPASVASAAGKSMDLTANVDTTLVGGAGNDTYNASQTSLNSGDQLSGGAGTDTLQITTTAGAALGGGVISSGVEVISVTATVGAATIDATNFTGVTTVTSTGSTAAVTVDNLGVIPTVNVTGTNNSVTVNPTAASIIGTADSATINLNGAGTANGHAQVITVAGVESLTVNASGNVTLNAGLEGSTTTVNVQGNLQTTGSLTNVNLEGGNAQDITGTANLTNLTLNKSAGAATMTAGRQHLTGTLTLTSGTLAAGGYLTLKSTSTATARVAQHATSTGNVTGNVVVERFIPGSRKMQWRMLAFPYNADLTLSNISGIKINYTSPPTMMYFRENLDNGVYGNGGTRNGGYQVYTAANQTIPLGRGVSAWVYGDESTSATPGAGTLGAGGITVSSLGELNETGADVTIPVTNTAAGWNLVGNPFASTIDWEQVRASSTNLNATLYRWDPQAENWSNYNISGGTTGS